ncbi:DUF6289 family protein [Nonomuraea sp. NPDC050556]|uniref:DUF6289 family protein n=1 Tax=Nonomuraea sp. NPDC050556 TaxID=3364369 RepID=UPI0037950CED
MFSRIAVTVAVAAASLAMLPSTAQASFCKVGYTCQTTYYSDAAHTAVVGRYTADCGGATTLVGERSAYTSYYSTLCGP